MRGKKTSSVILIGILILGYMYSSTQTYKDVKCFIKVIGYTDF